MEKKMTKRDYYNEIIAIATEIERTDLVEFAKHEIELLDKKKSSGTGKVNETMSTNVELVYNELAKVEKATATELIAIGGLTALKNESGVVTTQKVSAYLHKLVESGRVKTIAEKKKTYFAVVELEEEEN